MTVKIREIPEGSGKWYVKIDWHQRRVSRLFPSPERAQEVAEKIGTALELYGDRALEMFRRPDPPQKARPPAPTVKEFAEKWERELGRRDLKYSTRISYASNLKHHIIPALGELQITDIDYAVCKAFVLSKVAGTYRPDRFRKEQPEPKEQPAGRSYSRNTIRIMVMTLRALMAEAVREKLVSTNPVADLAPFYRRQKQERVVRRAEAYSLNDLHQVEDVLRTQHPKFELDSYEFFLCMSRTGMRVGEARGLQLADLDLNTRTIEIQRNIPAGHGRLEDSTKGKVGRRTVDMSRDLHQALKAMLARRREVTVRTGQHAASAWLFHAPGCGPVDYNRLYHDWARANRIAGVRMRSPHSLRHTYASVNLARGEDLAYVSRQLGHANPGITLAIYTHFMPRKRRRASNALDRTAGGSSRRRSASNPQVGG